MDGTFNENDLSRVVEADRKNVWHHLIQHQPFESAIDPRIIVEGKGMKVWDQKGKEHLDAVSGGVWTVNVGYGRESIADAVRDQLVKLNYFAGSAGSIPGALFAEKLLEKMPGLDRMYYCNSGSEANEKAFKMVRQIAHKKYGGKKHKILYRDRDYHGTTIACLSAGGQDERNAQYGPFVPGFVRVPHCLEYRAFEQDGAPQENYGVWAADQIEKVILAEGPDTVGALCLEPVTAGGGVITPPDGYWERVQEICKKYDILLHIDEVVCGVGRTGTWFGYQHYGIQPDMVTMAKGVASGYAAIACLVTTEAVFDMFKDDPSDKLNYFRDISTFGGCTAGPAAAIENMRIIEDENLLENTTQMGAYMLDQLHALADKHAVIGDVRGKGLFLGAELVSDRDSRAPAEEAKVQAVVGNCMAQGVIIGATNRSLPGKNNSLCFSPALIATKDDINHIIAAVDKALGDVFG
ncbi:aminotransferase class III-fold pyridoxal phosphate-dependent enzyme [Sulfitobacter pseudonitzschiae]|uniref:Aminotransferase class III-fold pyridoxal phosphate-dependent enzyme n=1 Tax=Pseudosulfitobacter pseudonitzschiae TaxID=1402135 RepID=A0A9Q2P1Z5_9RHOB|nr:aminotransferase class III-fold pyridoxal phosphate-dependent enzyme [Pseudosulfitobacter pseudonitzschiae]MBM2292488.1 aminotransferase class III-fold pyridoxal phosphate-dependent enzyme [Pseudosulfitobacter pseudonitzschiae]MBM2297405.1 aminotransferase class III-fold pyridoxal phosphate-dependent enzyme [Pseudosulfitobacter pseudonitzschiae]MBM2302319.1 aminotransferase class III-fold pyridoxal phosphate-dependent enzyme [Pseudosulfitobacter pseudonitzschiae]MBM2312102.1 aminotransferase